jgi:hypothetical protein
VYKTCLAEIFDRQTFFKFKLVFQAKLVPKKLTATPKSTGAAGQTSATRAIPWTQRGKLIDTAEFHCVSSKFFHP